MTKHVRTLILGAGPTGLGAAYRLTERNDHDWLLVERETHPGGAASSVTDDQGFTWDMGGHVIHSRYQKFTDVITKCVREWSTVTRSGWVWIEGRFVPVPLQQNLGALSTPMHAAVLAELASIAADDRLLGPISADRLNLDTWFRYTFGETLTNAFFAPFNTKMWAQTPDKLGHQWTSLRSGSKVSNVPAPRTDSNGPVVDNSLFPYPRRGTGSMWVDIAATLPQERLSFGNGMLSINPQNHSVQLEDSSVVTYDHVISTVPLDQMMRMLGYEDIAGALLHSACAVVGLGFAGEPPEALASKTWAYHPSLDVPFHRASILSNYSDLIAGPGRWSILLETGTSPERPINRDTLVADNLAALRAWGVTDTPVSVWERYLPRGYPLPFLGRDEMLAPVMDLLESHDIYSRGRFGGWRYESCNQDDSFMQGYEAVNHALDGTVEQVYWPEREMASP